MREVNALFEKGADRIMAGRVERIGRNDARHQVHRHIHGRGVERPAVHEAVERRSLQRAESRRVRHAFPIDVERLARAFRAALHIAADQDGGVHGAGGSAGNRLDPDPGFFEQSVKHAPRIGAMRSTALEGKVHKDRLARPGARAVVFNSVMCNLLKTKIAQMNAPIDDCYRTHSTIAIQTIDFYDAPPLRDAI